MIDQPLHHVRECAESLTPFGDERCPACTWFLEQQALSNFCQTVQRESHWQFFQGMGKG